jgi:hypothetical protein
MGGFLFNFPLMQVGRFVFGIGGESLAVAQVLILMPNYNYRRKNNLRGRLIMVDFFTRVVCFVKKILFSISKQLI